MGNSEQEKPKQSKTVENTLGCLFLLFVLFGMGFCVKKCNNDIAAEKAKLEQNAKEFPEKKAETLSHIAKSAENRDRENIARIEENFEKVTDPDFRLAIKQARASIDAVEQKEKEAAATQEKAKKESEDRGKAEKEKERLAAEQAQKDAVALKKPSVETLISKHLSSFGKGDLLLTPAEDGKFNISMDVMVSAENNIFQALEKVRKASLPFAGALYESQPDLDVLLITYRTKSNDGLGNDTSPSIISLSIGRGHADKLNWKNLEKIDINQAFQISPSNDVVRAAWGSGISHADYLKIQKAATKHDIPVDSFITIYASAVAEWPNDYEMQQHVIGEQIKAYKQINQ